MPTSNRPRVAALTIGCVFGLLLFVVGFYAAFSITGASTGWDVLSFLSGFVVLLPLTVLGFFKPKVATVGLMVSAMAFLLSVLEGWAIPQHRQGRGSILGLSVPVLVVLIPSLSVGVLFWISAETVPSRTPPDPGDPAGPKR
jgi:hypothetical protein